VLLLVVERNELLNRMNNFTFCMAIRMPTFIYMFYNNISLTQIFLKQNLSKKLRRPREKTASIAQKVIYTRK
ncbi:hypothetical protein, partial [Pectobacterium aquaticum]|uniref:hypothetical protein n=1 Tax=Pectobacterium aquaticum TaxID=2204145 RepID=UPI001F1017A8